MPAPISIPGNPKYTLPCELPDPQAATLIVGSPEFRSTLFATLHQYDGFSGFWSAFCNAATHVSTQRDEHIFGYFSVSFENGAVPPSSPEGLELLGGMLPTTPGANFHFGTEWIDGPTLMSSRLYDYRLLLATYASRGAPRYRFRLPLAPDAFDFTEASRRRYIPAILTVRKDGEVPPDQVIANMADDLSVSEIAMALADSCKIAHQDILIEEAFIAPDYAVTLLLMHARTEVIMRLSAGMNDLPSRWSLVGILPDEIILNTEFGKKRHELRMPASAYWQTASEALETIRSLFSILGVPEDPVVGD